jgi:hypothetical protein
MAIPKKNILLSIEHATRLVANPCPPATSGGPPMRSLSVEEQLLVMAYRRLPTVPHLAARRYILWRDIRLARAIYHRVFLHIALGQLRDQPTDKIG